ncbi:MAG: biotin--[acetyl-CoA-carboxylase] ligase [Anaerolineales bacterium]|nr:biotin--[acetyl-CoA-carboxylase] ligase [Anaerolineales bacterium]
MNTEKLTHALSTLALGPICYLTCVGSTNLEATRWVEAGAPNLSLVVADEQTAGRGRLGKKWYTPAGAALAFSLILRPSSIGIQSPQRVSETSPTFNLLRLTALGALAVSEALLKEYSLLAEIKWPNDVLVQKRKIAGVLTEASWQGDQLTAAVLGIGVNVSQKSLPAETQLDFPAICVETVLGKQVERVDLLYSILEYLLEWRGKIDKPDFISDWENRLAYRESQVQVIKSDGSTLSGKICGLSPEGFLRLDLGYGEITSVKGGAVSLRPVNQ